MAVQNSNAVAPGPVSPAEGKAAEMPIDEASTEKVGISTDDSRTADATTTKKKEKDAIGTDITPAPPAYDSDSQDKEGHDDAIIITGADAALHLLPLRDDGQPALTFRSIFLASCLSCFQAVMNQIYTVRCLPRGARRRPCG